MIYNNFFSIKTLLFIILSLLVYLSISSYLMNPTLAHATIFGPHSLFYKIRLFSYLTFGMLNSMATISIVFLVATAILVGLNLALIIDRIMFLGKLGKLHFVVGGSSVLGIASGGCASCGISILAILGISGAVSYLPFRGLELSVLVITILAVSLYLQIKSYSKDVKCEIKK